MPIYEYHCPACKKTYELQQSFSAESTHTCEKCGKGTAKRVLHAPRVVFKGSGWYITDSRKSSSSTLDEDTDSASRDSKSDSKKDSSGETATAAAG